MADPKYANLPGIAYDQPDLYETKDLPEAEQIREDPDEESEAFEKIHISAPDAFSKFKDKYVSSAGVDFSDRLSKHRRRGYDARSEAWELAGEGEQETVMQRYQRLQCEIKDLLEEVSNLKEDCSQDVSNVTLTNQMKNILKQLEDLKLEKTLGEEVLSTLSDPQGAQLKKLVSQLDNLTTKQVEMSKAEEKSKTAKESVDGSKFVYKVFSNPHQSQAGQAARIADLEARINKLNSLVAVSPNALKRLGSDKSLVETAKLVAGKYTLLDPSQLDAVDARLSSLLTKLDQISERSSSLSTSTDPEKESKISELYDLVKRAEELSQVLPRAVERMMALETLHQQSSEFVKTLNDLEALQSVISAGCETNKEIFRQFEEKFTKNIGSLKENVESLDARIKALESKKTKK